MRILFVADGRSPIALNWLRYFLRPEDEVHLASTFACPPLPGLASLTVIPAAFSGLKRVASGSSLATPAATGQAQSQPKDWTSLGTVGLRTTVRQWLGPLTLRSSARRLQDLADRVQPDLVHAMRIPYEGMVAALAARSAPLLISVWGNDFTLHARSTPLMDRLTRQSLQAATALHTDCRRDMLLAERMGFPAGRLRLVAPGNGGLHLDVFQPSPDKRCDLSSELATIINPRGMRAYVRNDTFFKAVRIVAAQVPGVHILCPTMAGDPQAERWVDELGIAEQVTLLPRQSQAQMAELFRTSRVAVSPSEHDGTPNTLLEAMACGCFPVAGDIESLREWIQPGENGLLVDPGDSVALAEAILQALQQPELCRRAQLLNRELIQERADFKQVMPQVEQFYKQIIS
jgi:glycosyltransferase involved in cell wall biosynthesis